MSNPDFSPLLEVRCDRLGLFPDDCRDLEEATSDSALVNHPNSSPGQSLPSLSNFLGHDGQASLTGGRCPYCDAWLDGTTFIGEDDRIGGLVCCQPCRLQFAWIDSPFECEIQEDVSFI